MLPFIAQKNHQQQQILHRSAYSNFWSHFCYHDRMNPNGRNVKNCTESNVTEAAEHET